MYKGISGNEYDKHVERFDTRSTLSKLNIQFWEAKQTFLQKIVKREDDCIIAYDAELDSKLELFKSIADTSGRLLCVIEGYQDRLCILAHEESCIGRFLKECGRVNKNLISKMLTATGKTFYYSAQQRIQLRNPLINIYQNVETFQFKAVADTLITIEQMEKERTAYRASLLWMKSLSAKLDPDSYPELEKFRKVQNHVRKTKQKYDRKKIDCIQKVDMLNASRCNMLSQSLANYQTAWLTFWSNTAFTIATISNCFGGCQLNEIVTDIVTVQQQDNKHLNRKDNAGTDNENHQIEQDLLLLTDETGEDAKENNDDDDDDLLLLNNKNQKNNTTRQQKEDQLEKEIDLIEIDDSLDMNLFSNDDLMQQTSSSSTSSTSKITATSLQELQARKKQVNDLLTSSADSEDLILLNDILGWSSNEKSFLEKTSNHAPSSFTGQFNQFNFTMNTDRPFSFGRREKETSLDETQRSSLLTRAQQSDARTEEKEKKKWEDLFGDLDVFNTKKDKKRMMGDC